jgi:hypothetical protein
MDTKISTKSLKILLASLIFTGAFTLFGCSKNEHVKDLSNITIQIETDRFEQKLFSCKSAEDIINLSKSDSTFYKTFTEYIIASNVQFPGASDQDIAVELYKYISHQDMDSLYKITQKTFGDFRSYSDDFIEASKYILHYFPEDTINKITTFISTFHYGAIYDQESKQFGVGLDMYLGSDFEVYSLLNPENFPLYRTKKFEPYRIIPNCIQTYVDTKVSEYIPTTFVDQAVYEGKKLYLLDLLLPDYHDSLKINYLSGQFEWCEYQEENIWAYLVQEEELFNSDKNEIQKKYFNDGPFTNPFGNESSPRTGAWVGWQIVRSYMKNHPKISIHQLLNNSDHMSIFNQSGYRP